jgi:hypothetical protein
MGVEWIDADGVDWRARLERAEDRGDESMASLAS